jgi:hypothetical protein
MVNDYNSLFIVHCSLLIEKNNPIYDLPILKKALYL